MRNNCIDVKYGIDVETPQDLRASGMIKDKKAFGFMTFQTRMTIWVNGSFLDLSKKYIYLTKYMHKHLAKHLWFQKWKKMSFFLSVLRLYLFDKKIKTVILWNICILYICILFYNICNNNK